MINLGFPLPQVGALAREGDHVGWYAAEAEKLGVASLWVSDRVLGPVDPIVGYPGGPAKPLAFRAVLDPFAVLATAAAVTTTVRLGFNIIVAPMYAPALLYRSLNSLDVLSRGRLIPGLGVGWSPEEFTAAGVPFEERGSRLEETLDVLQALWGSTTAGHVGKHFTVPESHFELLPVQTPRPPIYLGGFTDRALRRVGRRADGWLPAIRLPDPNAVEVFRLQRETVRAGAREAGRPDTDLPAVVRANLYPGTSIAQATEAMLAFAEATGVTDVFVDAAPLARSVDDLLGVVGKFLAAVS